MPGREERRDLVQDPVRARADPATQATDHGLLELGILVDCCESGPKCSEDARDEDFDLEQCLLEEMDGMDASESEQSIESGFETETWRPSDLEELETTTDQEDSTDQANLEWSRFMISTEGVLKYMEEATAEIIGTSKLTPPPPHKEPTTHDSNTVTVAEIEPGSSSCNTPAEETRRLTAFLPQHCCEDMTATESSTCIPPSDYRGRAAAEILESHERISSDSAESSRSVSTKLQHTVKESESGAELAEIPLPSVGGYIVGEDAEKTHHQHCSPSRASMVSGSPGRGADPTPRKKNTAALSLQVTVPATDMPIPTASKDNLDRDRSAQSMPPSLLDNEAEDASRATGPELEIPFEVSRISASQQDESDRACMEGGTSMIAASFSRIEVIASVGEAEVSRRVEREKARHMAARQQRRDQNIERARLEGSVVAFQAVWRGRCARGKTAQALAARRRESEETKLMLQEERLVEYVVALEAERREVEGKLQTQDLNAMRCEEKRTRDAWMFLRGLEETARGEELVRMRAEERCTRALLDLELQDLRRIERGQREAEETVKMQSEDRAMRDLKCQEKTQALERQAMRAEDAMARAWKKIEQCELALSSAEGSRMAVEDRVSSAWNVECHRFENILLRQAWARSTPAQRAMHPRGVAAAQSLVCPCPTRSSRQGFVAAETRTGVELKKPSTIVDWRKTLMLERSRRRNCCKGHLERVSSSALRARCKRQAPLPIKGLDTVLAGYGRESDFRGGTSQAKAPSREGQVSTREDRGRPGGGVELTMDMLSHLGPMEDLTALELCVEGLTSASLLQACTSLKSLSLNVNRLSSPAGLAVSTSLVRLGLRDNRLSCLRGLSGLPSLRELRLDMNHLTSLHQLKQLPALIELSANTNHIRELPEGFAAGLLSSRVSFSDGNKNKKGFSTLVEKAVACGGLQKLELYHNRISFVHPRALQGLASLTHLDLGRNQLRELDGQGLEHCPALSSLVLSQNLLQEPPSPLCLPLLSELWLSGNKIGSMSAWASSPTHGVTDACSTRRPQRCTLSKDTLMGFSGGAVDGTMGDSPNATFRESCGTGSERRGRADKTGQGGSEGERRDGTLSGGEGESTGEIGVWLPSLEILHLHDNALETLGGRSVFVGCPLLRSFDASFNQLRTPDEISMSLQACGELEEVRLHDNPASACQNYTDAVALSCPNLTRMDGVQLDSKAHWRAGASAYGGRADLVLPFLLDTDETSGGAHGVEVAAATVPTSKTSARESKKADGVGVEEACPWCGTGMPCKEQAADTSGGRVTGSGLEARGDGGGKDEDLDLASRARNDRFLGRATCTSCGFTLPDTDLWSVPESACSLKWNDLNSAGERWRGEFCPYAGVQETGETTHGERKASSTFRDACIRGRDERTSMRRRHRREERDLAARADLPGPKPRATNVQGNHSSRTASMPPSTWRLDEELELGKQQAEERREQASRQLSFHGGGGDVDHGGTNGTGVACVVVDLEPSATAGKQARQATGSLPDSLKKGRPHERPGRRQSRAAGLIQRLWKRHRERKTLVRRDPEVGTKEPAKEQAVMKLQSAFRGFHVRRALQAALESARYVDDELEDLLNVSGGTPFELDRFLCPPPELADAWWRDSNTTTAAQNVKNVSRQPSPPSRARATSSRLIDTALAVVSNTPLPVQVRGEYDVHTPSETDLDSPVFVRDNEQHNNVGSTRKANNELRSKYPRAVVDSGKEGDPASIERPTRSVSSGGGVSPAREGGKALANAWGLKDPTVARAMIKRAKRMRNFQNGEARREKLKNPDVRFDVFVRNAGGRKKTRVGSSPSDHGGDLDTHRSGGSEGGWGQGPGARSASPRLAPIVDAWVRSKVSDNAVVATDPSAKQNATARGRPWPPTKPSRPVAHKARGGRHRTPLCAHDLGAEVLLSSGPLLTGGKRRAGVG